MWIIVYAGFWISVFFKHMRGLLYVAGFLGIFLLFFYRKSIFIWSKSFINVAIILLLFLASLLPGIFLSPFPWASVDAYCLNYFFHVVLFFLLIARFSLVSSSGFSLWPIPFMLLLVAFFHYVLMAYEGCFYNFVCWLQAGMSLMEASWLKGLVSTSSAFTFTFFLFGGLSLKLCRHRKILMIGSFLSLFFLFWFARRAAILGLFVGLVMAGLLCPSRKIFRTTLIMTCLLGMVLAGLLAYPLARKTLLLRGDKIDLILSGSREDLARSGSLGMRLYIWPLYLKEASKRIFKGTGLGRRVQKRVLSDLNRRALNLEHAHNLFLNMWLQAGLFPVFLFVIFYGLTLKRALWWLKNSGDPLAVGMLAFLLAFLLMSFFEGMEEMTRFTPFWMASGIVWGYAAPESSLLSR
ncbi:O-antigen ligase family protein [Thermosulfurimonas marina]|uniref:O-antigen ligase family protein n=1 Tax=Thermosulfurimonas marina TaxID=2047767 RepID=UPI001B301F77|nr:O-antigen ligase family protein [Thermosulfurimonas marina]